MTVIKLVLCGMALSLVLQVACGGPAPISTEDPAAAAASLTAVPNGAPGGGLGFCCIRGDGRFWSVGDTDPVTGQVMTTQAMVNGACGSGHLPIRRAC